jgi:alkylated DNA repair dioxygenase AlkB
VVSWQASLLDDGLPSVKVGFDRLERLQLDEHSWVDHVPGWLRGADALFGQLLAIGDWRQRERYLFEQKVLEPRLTAGFSIEAGASTDDAAMPPALAAMAGALSDRYGVVFDRVWVNLYRDGRDSVAWHRDRNGRVHRNPLVATVSLGEPRRFLLRPRASRQGVARSSHRLELGGGDLVVMGGACQHDWEHTVPKTSRSVGARMSVTIRHSVGEPL